MKVLVTGSRDWDNRDLLFDTLDGLHSSVPITALVEGCARGADSLAEEWAKSVGVEILHFPADWKHHGRAAGPLRNRRMIQTEPDLVVAFHHNIGESKGTKDMVTVATVNGVPVMYVT